MKLENDGWSWSTMGEVRASWMKPEHHGWSWSMIDEAWTSWVMLELDRWSWSIFNEAGDGLYSVMSRSRFRLVYRQAMYSRHCVLSCGSSSVSRARDIHTCGCKETQHFRLLSFRRFLSSWLDSWSSQCTSPIARFAAVKHPSRGILLLYAVFRESYLRCI